ncbi:MAG: RNA-binding cell elongation regulator Jag/EloR [Spirochaetia bacterium]
MIKDFEGKTEQEAIDSAIEELNLDREEFDVEIVESSKKGIFRKGNVKIRVYIEEEEGVEEESREYDGDPEPQDEFEEKVIEHLETIIEKMGYPGKVHVGFRETAKIGLNIDSEHSGILIGKKGKNLDALQLLTNIYAGKLDEDRRVIVDAENYRSRHEESIVRMANKTASQVRRSRRSRLLDPMNPFERRLVHTALNGMEDIETKSEGDGMYKQVRIIYRGKAANANRN